MSSNIRIKTKWFKQDQPKDITEIASVVALVMWRQADKFTINLSRELADFARLTGEADVLALSIADLCTVNSEISGHTAIEHV